MKKKYIYYSENYTVFLWKKNEIIQTISNIYLNIYKFISFIFNLYQMY